MKRINLNKQEGVTFLLYPDNQPHVNLPDIYEHDVVEVVCSIDSSLTLIQLLETANAIDNLFAKKHILHIPYLMGARFDRLMQHGDSIDLQVIANLINLMQFEKVYLYDVHSDVSTMVIKNSVNIDNKILVDEYNVPDSVLICPDAGAVKKVGKYLDWNKNITDVVYCIKDRDLTNGKISLKVLEPEKCKGRNCVVIDDLCDGGGTFLGIASQIEPADLSLIVTHGVFSQGYSKLLSYYNHIITSNSRIVERNSRVKVVNLLT